MASVNAYQRLFSLLPHTLRQCARQVHKSAEVSSAALNVKFDEAKEKLNTLPEPPDNTVQLQMYGLFKQATKGTCDIPAPGAMNFVAKAKWDAWNSLGELSQAEAQNRYIELVSSLLKVARSTETQEDTGKYKWIKAESDGNISTITFNRPHRKNAFNYDMCAEVTEALKEAAQDDTKFTVLTGSGDYYSSGNDLSMFSTMKPADYEVFAKEAVKLLGEICATMVDHPKPLVAVVNGPGVGFGVTSLALCDVVYCTDKAFFFAPMIGLGMSPEGLSSYTFPKVMGYARAMEVLLCGRKFSAQEASDWGLVSQVFPDNDFQEKVARKLKAMAEMPKGALAESKRLVRDVDREALHRTNKAEGELMYQRWLSKECAQSVMKFLTAKPAKS